MRGLGLVQLGRFSDHEGFDGVILGTVGAAYHVELTYCRAHPVPPCPTPEDLLVFYVSDPHQWEQRCRAMLDAGFTEVQPLNPYWSRSGRTYQDHDGYRVVIQQASWCNSPEE
jgi:hypothetical protein